MHDIETSEGRSFSAATPLENLPWTESKQMNNNSLPRDRRTWQPRLGIDTFKARIKLDGQSGHLRSEPAMPPGWTRCGFEKKLGKDGLRWSWKVEHSGLGIIVDAYVGKRHDDRCTGHIDIEFSVATLLSATRGAHLNLLPAPPSIAQSLVYTLVQEVLARHIGVEVDDLSELILLRMDVFLDIWPRHPLAFIALWEQHPPAVAYTASQEQEEHVDNTTRRNKGKTSIKEYRNAFNTKAKGAKTGGSSNLVYMRDEAVQHKIQKKFKDPEVRKRLLARDHWLWERLRGCVRIEAEHGRESPGTCCLPKDRRDRKKGFKGDQISLSNFADETLWSLILQWRLYEKGWGPTSGVVSFADERDVVEHVQGLDLSFAFAVKVLWLMKYGAKYCRKHHDIKASEIQKDLRKKTPEVFFLTGRPRCHEKGEAQGGDEKRPRDEDDVIHRLHEEDDMACDGLDDEEDEDRSFTEEEDVVRLLWKFLSPEDRTLECASEDDNIINEKLVLLLGSETKGTRARSRNTGPKLDVGQEGTRLMGFTDDGLGDQLLEDEDIPEPLDGPDIELLLCDEAGDDDDDPVEQMSSGERNPPEVGS